MIKTIIFDYAGVLTPTKDKLDFANSNHEKFNMTIPELMDILYKNWHKASINEITAKQYWQDLGNKLKTDPGKLKKSIIDTFPLDYKLIKLIEKLKANYKIVMLSNQIEDWLEEVIDNNNIRDKFDYFCNSYQIGMKKPDEKIFLIALEQTNSKPNETLFIDDSLVNITKAQELGINTIQFETYDQFIIELKKFIPLEIK